MPPKLLAYLQLFRFPNVFTAIADVAMGFYFTQLSVNPPTWFLPLMFASCFLYIAGMVLNDVFDYDVDKAERPERPLPSGRIDLAWARQLGFGMLAVGVLLAFLAGVRSGAVALLLAVAVYVYDGVAKKTEFAPLVMGSCRMLNVLLGMSCATAFLQSDQLLIAAGLGVYVAGITWFARCEAKDSDRRTLQFGLAVMVLGIALLAAFPWFSETRILLRGKMLWPTLLVLLMSIVVRRCMFAIANPSPENVQAAVKNAIFSLVMLDAAVVLAVVGVMPALAVLALLIPTVFLGKWIYST